MRNKKFFFGAISAVILAASFILTAPTARALTTLEINDLIVKLQQQIAELQKQLAGMKEKPAVWCHDFNLNLKFDDGTGEAAAKEDEVRNLQVALEKEGFEINDGERKGGASFGESTAASVVGFQQKYQDEVLTPLGLKFGTGYVGKATRTKLNKLYGCGKITPPTISPSVTVLSPNGGENLVAGQPYIIKWQTLNVPYWADIYLVNDELGTEEEIRTRVSQIGKYEWVVGDLRSGSLIVPGTKYKIKVNGIIGSGFSPIGDSSDSYFSIVSSEPTTGSINVISPNGGEQWKPGETRRISWTSSGVNSVKLYIYNPTVSGSGSTNYIISSGSGAVKSVPAYYDWTIPVLSQLPGGGGNNYKIRIDDAENSAVSDSSDGYFSIASEITYSDSIVPEMAYPQDGQALSYGSPNAYIFKVNPISGASGYRFQFYQSGVLLYDNLINKGKLSSNGEFGFWPGDKGYSLFQKGDVAVKIRALINNNWSKERAITIKLSNPDLQPTFITNNKGYNSWFAGDKVIFDTGISNNGLVGTGAFNVKWFVDDVQVGYGLHSGVPGNSTVMNGNSQFTWTAVEGEHAIKFVVDSDNYVAESDETNNTAIIYVKAWENQPSIAVLSPNGGEQWTFGTPRTITWTSTGLTKGTNAKIALQFTNGTLCNLSERNVLDGIQTVTLQENQSCPGISYLLSPGQYKAHVYVASETSDKPLVSDSSDNYFSIVSATVATNACADTDWSGTNSANLVTKGTCADSSGTYVDVCADNNELNEYYCGPTQQEPKSCLYTTYFCTGNGFAGGCSAGACVSSATSTNAILNAENQLANISDAFLQLLEKVKELIKR